MAFTTTSVFSGASSAAFTVKMDQDTDIGGTITHGIAVAVPLVAQFSPLVFNVYNGKDTIALPGATTVAYSKQGVNVAEGSASQRALVWLMLPHSLIR